VRVFSYIGLEIKCFTDVDEVFDAAINIHNIKKCFKVVNECRGLVVDADSLLRSVFFNLIDDYIKHRKIVSQIKLSSSESENLVQIIYEDNGVGIPDDIRKKLFEEGNGRHTGYGLYI